MTEPTEAECFEAEQEILFDVRFRQLDREIRKMMEQKQKCAKNTEQQVQADSPDGNTATTAKTFEPTKKENKSKKLLLLLKPTLHERLKTKAASFDMSINELVNQILEQNV